VKGRLQNGNSFNRGSGSRNFYRSNSGKNFSSPDGSGGISPVVGDDETYRCDSWKLDLKIGGAWRCEGKNKAGRPFFVEGEFLEINPPASLAYTWNPSWQKVSARVRWILSPREGGTLLIANFSGFGGNQEARRDHAGGLPGVMAWLKRYRAPTSQQPSP
jgi:uncharacterized protein YndB with AHSA1/START domain